MGYNDLVGLLKRRRIVLAVLVAVGIGVALAIVVSQESGNHAQGATNGPAVEQGRVVLPAIFEAAEACLVKCDGEDLVYSERGRFKLPYKFVELLKEPKHQTAFNNLVHSFPKDFRGLAQLEPGDREGLEFEGRADALLVTPDGRELQIYYDVGFPEKNWSNHEEYRRPSGIFWVAVDVQDGKMAAIFNGPNNLSDYQFKGDDDIIAPLLAYLVASQVHSTELERLGFPDEAPRLVFPISRSSLGDTVDRLRYLAGYYQNGRITGSQTISAIQDAEDEAAGRNWYTYNSSQTECYKSGGPAAKLDEFVGYIDQPTTNEFRDENGNLTKVEVVNDQGDGTENVWTYYRHLEDCERDWVTRTEDLADRYR